MVLPSILWSPKTWAALIRIIRLRTKPSHLCVPRLAKSKNDDSVEDPISTKHPWRDLLLKKISLCPIEDR